MNLRHPSSVSRPRFLVLSLWSLVSCLTAWAQLVWETTRVELTPADITPRIVAAYPFKNTGATEVRILNIKSTCGCTVPELDKKIYAPGETGELKATFDVGSRQGLQTKIITVTTDAGETQLHLVARLPQRVGITPRLLLFRDDEPLTPRQVKITFGADLPVAQVSLSDPGAGYKAELIPDPGAPAPSGESPRSYQLTITPQTRDPALLNVTLSIHSKGASGASYADTLFLRHAPNRSAPAVPAR